MISKPDIYNYREIQKFSQSKLVYLIIPMVIIPLVVTVAVFKDPEISANEAVISVIISIFFLMFVIGLLFFTRLEIFLTSKEIIFRYYPFQIKYKKLDYSEIKNYAIREYSPIMDYGGWGIRYAFKNGWAYNVSGKMGIQIEKTDGKKILFGTRKENDFFLALDSSIKKLKKEF